MLLWGLTPEHFSHPILSVTVVRHQWWLVHEVLPIRQLRLVEKSQGEIQKFTLSFLPSEHLQH